MSFNNPFAPKRPDFDGPEKVAKLMRALEANKAQPKASCEPGSIQLDSYPLWEKPEERVKDFADYRYCCFRTLQVHQHYIPMVRSKLRTVTRASDLPDEPEKDKWTRNDSDSDMPDVSDQSDCSKSDSGLSDPERSEALELNWPKFP
ncbi:hypothetical protein VTJ49DRAFT_3502 [Mycothermus thermophilus]|uniref:Uncharacterized protein n=1 Tax=Humicola insolens TaxID=85995 RepID=A0ABR3V7E1_HUMIN